MTSYNLNKIKQDALPRPASAIAASRDRLSNEPWQALSRQIAIQLNSLMLETNISQADLAHALHLSQTNVARLLSGKTNLTLKTICKLQDTLNISIISPTISHAMPSPLPQ